MAGNRYFDDFGKIDWSEKIVALLGFLTRPLSEIINGIRTKSIPLHLCFGVGCFASLLILTHLDKKIFGLFHIGALYLGRIYPTTSFVYWAYCFCSLTVGFWIWGHWRSYLRRQLVTRLTEVFTSAGLKSPLGKLPSFINDVPIDEFSRKLRLTRANLSKKAFEDAKDILGSSLQVYIDEIKEERESGLIDIIYSHTPMPTYAELENIKTMGPDLFAIGRTRSKQLVGSLKNIPHLMIAGVTGKGKSTFLRAFITVLFLNNKDFEFTLIDLKGGLEFQLFEELERVEVVPSIDTAIPILDQLLQSLHSRMAILKGFGCKDIESYQAMARLKKQKTKDIVLPPLNRQIIVVDEAAELFLAGGGVDNRKIQEARRIMSQIARQGRSVGLHLVLGTQRPDARAIDPQVKANLPGILCFQMLNDASSISVLGNGRATDLPAIPGRAIWKCGNDMIEVQAPYLSPEVAEELLKEFRKTPEKKSQETKVETTPPRTFLNSQTPVGVS